ncbi:MAG TPA: hypothetical protein GX731_06600 [Clostridiales bacterium]|nr:hypothetical protein [Clostridiales bacterium]
MTKDGLKTVEFEGGQYILLFHILNKYKGFTAELVGDTVGEDLSKHKLSLYLGNGSSEIEGKELITDFPFKYINNATHITADYYEKIMLPIIKAEKVIDE